jgi:hypothetical protein
LARRNIGVSFARQVGAVLRGVDGAVDAVHDHVREARDREAVRRVAQRGTGLP